MIEDLSDVFVIYCIVCWSACQQYQMFHAWGDHFYPAKISISIASVQYCKCDFSYHNGVILPWLTYVSLVLNLSKVDWPHSSLHSWSFDQILHNSVLSYAVLSLRVLSWNNLYCSLILLGRYRKAEICRHMEFIWKLAKDEFLLISVTRMCPSDKSRTGETVSKMFKVDAGMHCDHIRK